jgi:hypothetical protein
MKITKITIGRLFNLGSYEHIRYELCAEVADGESAEKALTGIERILEALNPKAITKSQGETDREIVRLEAMRRMDDDEFSQHYGGSFKGTRKEYQDRISAGIMEEIEKRHEWKNRNKRARQLLDDLGGAAEWKDAKLSWEDDDF